MGLFDGRDGKTEHGSTAEIAKWLNAPVILVIDCWALSRSVAAFVKGFVEFDPDLRVGGVVLNRTGGDFHTQWLREAIEAYDPSLPVLGGVPKSNGVTIPERHLGLHMPTDFSSTTYITALANLMTTHLNLPLLLSTPPLDPPTTLTRPDQPLPLIPPTPSRIGIAKDAAFCFYYHTNLHLLTAYGATLITFSPLSDHSLPPNLHGLYIGGGYPELHAPALSSNKTMLRSIREFKGCVYAECGGLMYLGAAIQTKSPESTNNNDEWVTHNMVGIFPYTTRMTGTMSMAYTTTVPTPHTSFFPPLPVRGHMYHFSSILPDDHEYTKAFKVTKQRPGAVEEEEGFVSADGRVVATYVHTCWRSCREFARGFVEGCAEVRGGAS
ncbi:hypothetical protein HK104_001839 [Borealophlyctis nickersoniae]|nr:hypothetical protein HK104_001839 [Borealophlyctis nickersoniae]